MADIDNPYVTYHNEYIESVWWALYEIFKRVSYTNRIALCRIARATERRLSSHELAQGYKDVTEDSICMCFKVAGADNEFLLAWTTAPWTLPSNVGLCVNAKEYYAKVSHDGRVYILAHALVEKNFGEGAEVLVT